MNMVRPSTYAAEWERTEFAAMRDELRFYFHVCLYSFLSSSQFSLRLCTQLVRTTATTCTIMPS